MEIRMRTVLASVVAVLSATACRYVPLADPVSLSEAGRAIRAEDLMRDVTALSSDEFEGRGPGTVGEERTLAYLQSQFELAGAQPGNPAGGWLQEVPLVGFTAKAHMQLRVGEAHTLLSFPEDFVAVTRHPQAKVSVGDSEMVFVGYGVVSPEHGWDDYKEVDVRGKTVVMLVNDPPVPDPTDPQRLDPQTFRGAAMTYFGRWTYKYEMASERGAAAAVLIHETGPAGYPWEVVVGSWGRENFDIRRSDANAGRVPVEAWLSEDAARRLMKSSGRDFDQLKAAAVQRDFQPVVLGARAAFEIDVELRQVTSHNVAAVIPGRGSRADEWIVYTAHWDHLGNDPNKAPDGIYNGAVDNATGTAALLAIARAFASLPDPAERSVLLLAVTAEEKGLLGSKYYAANPLYPLEKTLCNINMDALNPWGRTRDVVSIGLGQTTLDEVLEAEAARQGRVVIPDAEPEKGFYFRSDHFEFAKRGVPALYADSGVDFRDRPEGWGRQRRDTYTDNDYHKPSDEIGDDWDLSGLVEDVKLFFRVGRAVCKATTWPTWKLGSEFRAARNAMLEQ
jgi:Zn-dependent M28 family amino/carboxypeptidase